MLTTHNNTDTPDVYSFLLLVNLKIGYASIVNLHRTVVTIFGPIHESTQTWLFDLGSRQNKTFLRL